MHKCGYQGFTNRTPSCMDADCNIFAKYILLSLLQWRLLHTFTCSARGRNELACRMVAFITGSGMHERTPSYRNDRQRERHPVEDATSSPSLPSHSYDITVKVFPSSTMCTPLPHERSSLRDLPTRSTDGSHTTQTQFNPCQRQTSAPNGHHDDVQAELPIDLQTRHANR